MIRLADLPPALIRAYAIGLGLLFGSFLNVVIYRVPRGMSVVRPRSHCPGCGAAIAAYDNIPVLSYLVLRGKARCCGARISPRYALVELAGGFLAWAILEAVVFQLPASTSLGRAAAVFGADLFLALALVAVAFIDLEHMYVPDAVTFGGSAVGILTTSLRDGSFTDALLGAVLGFAMVWVPFSLVYRLVRHRTGMGLGDAKLVMLAGAWFGWQGAVFALLVGAVQGTLGAVALLVARGRIDEPAAIRAEKLQAFREIEAMPEADRKTALDELAKDPLYEPSSPGIGQARIAFGPFLALAMIEYLLLGRIFIERYWRWLGAG